MSRARNGCLLHPHWLPAQQSEERRKHSTMKADLREATTLLRKLVAEVPRKNCYCEGGRPCLLHGRVASWLKGRR